MKFLIDTNIFIPLEPTEYDDLEDNALLAADFDRLSTKAQQQLFLHPAQAIDISKDSDERRRHVREIQFKKYPYLSNPPIITEELENIIGKATYGTNDWVDNQLLTSLKSDAVDYLVTEDTQINQDRGRERPKPSPPSEPCGRFSRTRLSSRQFPHRD